MKNACPFYIVFQVLKVLLIKICKIHSYQIFYFLFFLLKKQNFMATFYRWGSTALRLDPLRGDSLLFTTKFPEIPGTPFCWPRKDEKLSCSWSHPMVLNMGHLHWESSTLTTRPLLFIRIYISRYHFSEIFKTSFSIIGCLLTERPKSGYLLKWGTS